MEKINLKRGLRALTVIICACLLFSLSAGLLSVGAADSSYGNLKLIAGGVPFGVKFNTDGVVVVNVSRGTSVYEAGLSIYDVITEFNGTEVKDIETLKELLSKSKAGATVTLKFYRIGRRGEESKTHTIEFKLDSAQ